MPSTTPPRGPDSSAGPLATESGLERAFRARFDSTSAAARPHLEGVEDAAHRVVEALFLQAWNERARLGTAEALDAFLKEQLPHVAAREKARLATAHHFGASDAHKGSSKAPQITVDQTWARLQHRLHPDRVKAAGAVKDASRHEAASRVKGLGRKRNWIIPVVIVIAAVIVAFGITKYLNRLGRAGVVLSALQAGSTKPTQTQASQIANVNLSDGSHVKLGPDSKLIVADGFDPGMRAIQLEGVAAITVAPGLPNPLEVHAHAAIVRATSGMLFVRTFADSSLVIVAQGATDSVRVGKDARALHDGVGLYIGADGSLRFAQDAERAETTTWNSDTLTVAARPMRQVLAELREWYGTKIVITDSTLLNRRVSFSAPLGSAVDAIAAIEKAGNVKFGYEGEAMVFRDNTKKK